MYRVIVLVTGALALAGCSSSPDWLNLDVLKPAPITDTVRFEFEPPAAEAKTSTGQTCRTPCALALSVNAPVTVTFTLNGYQPETESLEPIVVTGSPTQLRPNPVVVELTPASPPPPAKPVKKPAAPAKKKPATPKTSSASRPRPPATPAPAPGTAAPQQQQPAAPWPSTSPQPRQ